MTVAVAAEGSIKSALSRAELAAGAGREQHCQAHLLLARRSDVEPLLRNFGESILHDGRHASAGEQDASSPSLCHLHRPSPSASASASAQLTLRPSPITITAPPSPITHKDPHPSPSPIALALTYQPHLHGREDAGVPIGRRRRCIFLSFLRRCHRPVPTHLAAGRMVVIDAPVRGSRRLPPRREAALRIVARLRGWLRRRSCRQCCMGCRWCGCLGGRWSGRIGCWCLRRLVAANSCPLGHSEGGEGGGAGGRWAARCHGHASRWPRRWWL